MPSRIVSLPLMPASVGDLTCSITIANGSVTPVSISAWRSAISPSNLDIKSVSGATAAGSAGNFSLVRSASVIESRLQLLDGIDQLADGLDLRLHGHRDDDVELVLDRRDEIHHGQTVPFEVVLEGGRIAQRRALLVERLNQAGDFFEDFCAVGHGFPLLVPRAVPAKCGGFPAGL